MALYLHNPASEAHLEDLKDRLEAQLTGTPHDAHGAGGNAVLINRLVAALHAMDRGSITTKEVLDTFTRHRVPGFNFGRWLVEMVDEGIYLDAIYDEAA